MAIAPAATPADVVSKLNGEIATVMNEPAITKQVVDLGMLPVERASSDALRAFVKSEIDTWGAVVRKAGIAASQ
jgi:tripartite-type tricarboxylate transporter receptor subunit TctC